MSVKVDVTSAYASKTDDELLALAADRRSLAYEAQSALWEELKRRKLNDPRQFPTSIEEEDDLEGQNPAFNTPAQIAAAALSIGLVALLARMIVAVVESQETLDVLIAFLLIFGSIFGAIAWGTHRALKNRPIPPSGERR